VSPDDLVRGLPGESLVRQGLADFQSGLCTVPASLVAIAQTRLRRSGLLPERVTRVLPDAELHLYRLLRRQKGDAYSRYNALLRELVSFEQALDRRLSQKLRPGKTESRARSVSDGSGSGARREA